jgi:hypothetical protein
MPRRVLDRIRGRERATFAPRIRPWHWEGPEQETDRLHLAVLLLLCTGIPAQPMCGSSCNPRCPRYRPCGPYLELALTLSLRLQAVWLCPVVDCVRTRPSPDYMSGRLTCEVFLVLPSISLGARAYQTCVSANSEAVLSMDMDPVRLFFS